MRCLSCPPQSDDRPATVPSRQIDSKPDRELDDLSPAAPWRSNQRFASEPTSSTKPPASDEAASDPSFQALTDQPDAFVPSVKQLALAAAPEASSSNAFPPVRIPYWRSVYATLTLNYRSKRWYWNVVVLLRRLTIVLLYTFLTDEVGVQVSQVHVLHLLTHASLSRSLNVLSRSGWFALSLRLPTCERCRITTGRRNISKRSVWECLRLLPFQVLVRACTLTMAGARMLGVRRCGDLIVSADPSCSNNTH